MVDANKRVKNLSEAAKRARKEAEERRNKALKSKKSLPKEYNGAEGPEPTRFGDWEKKGIISDF